MKSIKRSESSIVTACCNYLQVLMNNRKITWFSRLQSGNVFTGKRMIRMCKPGTPDILVVDTSGKCWWLEAKTDKGKQSELQKDFQDMIILMPNHFYNLIRSIDDLKFFNQ